MNDTDPDEVPETEPETIWVSVAEAAAKSGVATGTVRQWYRSGRLPTQRSQGVRGSFLVPLDAVVALGRGDEEGDAIVADLIDLNASYWSAQTEAAREEATAARDELAEAHDLLDQASGELRQVTDELAAAREQLEFLRSQLAETSEDDRRLREQVTSTDEQRRQLRDENASLRNELTDVRGELDRTNDELGDTRSRVAALETELDKLRAISTATGSITDNSWLSLPTNTYRSPVRPQGMAAAGGGGALAGLIADTTPDQDTIADDDFAMPSLDDEHPAAPPVADGQARDEIPASERPHETPEAAIEPVPAPSRRVKPVFGIHDDDLLPHPEKKGRRGRR
jgi:hypothetical protein